MDFSLASARRFVGSIFRPSAGRFLLPVPRAAAFEAAEPSINRGVVYFNTTDPKQEVPAYTRLQILKLARWLYNNVGPATYIVEHLAQRAVGTGLVVQPQTSNREWNKLVDRYFEDRTCAESWAFDAAAQTNFYTAQSLILRQVMLDGDFFAQFLKTKENAARVRFLGGEVISGIGTSTPQAHDGILLDQFGAPVSFRVLTNRAKGLFTDVPARDMLHFRHIRRAGQPRGVSWLHSAVNNLRDISEIRGYVKGSYKTGSQVAYVLTSNEAIRVGLGAGLKQDHNLNADLTTEDMPNGVLLPRLRPGERLESFKNEIPGSTYEPLMRDIMQQICFGIGLPPEAMFMTTGLAGTEQRAVLEVTQNFLERLQQMLVDQFCRPFYKYWLWAEIQSGRIPYPGEDWWRHEWLAPRKITVDSGRDARAFSEQLDKGHLSPTRYHNMLGLRATDEEDDIIETYLRRKEKCEALGLDVAQVFPNTIRNRAAAQQPADPSDAPDPSDSPTQPNP